MSAVCSATMSTGASANGAGFVLPRWASDLSQDTCGASNTLIGSFPSVLGAVKWPYVGQVWKWFVHSSREISPICHGQIRTLEDPRWRAIAAAPVEQDDKNCSCKSGTGGSGVRSLRFWQWLEFGGHRSWISDRATSGWWLWTSLWWHTWLWLSHVESQFSWIRMVTSNLGLFKVV